MVRKESQVDEMAEFGVETVVADLTGDVSHAVPGHDAIIFAAGSGGEDVEGVDRDGAIELVDAAEEEGVDRFVMLSAMNADEPENSPDGLYDYLVAKQAADEYLQIQRPHVHHRPPGRTHQRRGNERVKTARKLDRGEIHSGRRRARAGGGARYRIGLRNDLRTPRRRGVHRRRAENSDG